MKKYFGILNNVKVNNLSQQKQLDFLLDNNLFYVSQSYSINMEGTEIKVKKEKTQIDVKPVPEVVNTFYDYLRELFSGKIDRPFLLFFNDYNESTYGFDKLEQRKVALQGFNELFKKIKVLKANFVRREKDDNGIEQVKNMNRFDFLKGRQDGQKRQLATIENVLEYLNGNEDYFKSEQFLNKTNTKLFIEFESNLKILVSLNSQHKFEDDFHFSDLGLLKILFDKYKDTFKSLEVFIYTHKRIQSFTESKPAHISSLYDALFEMRFISNSKTRFMNYVNIEHQMKLRKLKYFQPEENRQHDQRLQQFKLELGKYSTEN